MWFTAQACLTRTRVRITGYRLWHVIAFNCVPFTVLVLVLVIVELLRIEFDPTIIVPYLFDVGEQRR